MATEAWDAPQIVRTRAALARVTPPTMRSTSRGHWRRRMSSAQNPTQT